MEQISDDTQANQTNQTNMCLAHGEDNVLHMVYFEVDSQCVCLYATQSHVMKEGIKQGWWKENEKVYFYWCPLVTTNK